MIRRTPGPTEDSQPGGTTTYAQVTLDDRGVGKITVVGEADELILGEKALPEARGAALALLADRAKSQGRNWRVTAVDPDGTWELIITAQGEVREADPLVDDGDDLADDEDKAGQRPTRFLSRQELRERPRLNIPQRWRPPRLVIAVPRRSAAFITVGAVVLLLVVFSIVSWWTSATPRPSVEQAAGTFAGNPPAEWDRTGRWVSPRVLPGSGRALVVGQDVAVITADRKVTLLDGSNGAARWTSELPEGAVHTDLASTTVDGAMVIAVHVGSTLAWWSGEGDRRDLTLPEEAAVSFLGTSPLVSLTRDTSAIVVDGHLDQNVRVPTGATPLAATATGVTAASPAGWWHLKPGALPQRVRPWETPDGTPFTPTLISYSARSILLVNGTKQKTLYVYRDRDTDIRFSFGASIPGREPISAGDWHSSPSRTWGILRHTLVDLEAGSTRDLGPQWRTRHVATDRALGISQDRQLIAGPKIPLGVIAPGEAFPEDTVGADGIVRTAGGDAGDFLYVLPPKTPNG